MCSSDLGADGARTIVVVAPTPGLAAAIREHTPREVALVRWTTGMELADAWARTKPWPWIVVGSGTPPAELAARCRDGAAVVAWVGCSAEELPAGGILLSGWPGLGRWVDRLPGLAPAGLRLSPYRGVRTPDGVDRSAPVAEALLAAHPAGIPDSALVRRTVGRLRRWGVACHSRRDGELLRLAIGSRRRKRGTEGG